MEKAFKLLAGFFSIFVCVQVMNSGSVENAFNPESGRGITREVRHRAAKRQIIFVTPTREKPERMADITMLSQTLRHLANIHWIVIEDATSTNQLVDDLLRRSAIPYTYLHSTNEGLPCRGWAHRNLALNYLRLNRNQFGVDAVIYFADDDNGYDLRLFEDYVRNVEVVGVWAVGLPGFGRHGPVEAPKVEKDKVVGWLTAWRPQRRFATDMAGFAVNLDLALRSSARFDLRCAGTMPEDCFLSQLNVTLESLQPFGHQSKRILVWHRKTASSKFVPYTHFGYHGVQRRLEKDPLCDRFYNIHDMDYITAKKFVAAEKPGTQIKVNKM